MASFTVRNFRALYLSAGVFALFATGCGLDEAKTCDYGGKSYQDGETIPNDCADCECKGGDVVCPTIACAPEECALPWDAGPCEAEEDRFWHNPETGQCEEVTYGGCEGNENNFTTLDECQSTCLAFGTGGSCTVGDKTYQDGESFPSDDGCNTCTCVDGAAGCTKIGCEAGICDLPFEQGSCDAAFPRFWHNAASGACEEVIYGGCDGNENNFETLEDCRSACVTSCTQGDKTYEDGASFPAGDGCNSCTCDEGTIACTLIGCDPSPETSCQVDQTVYSHGATNVPDPTSCNTCTCEAGEIIECTEIHCPEECPEGRTLGQDCTSCGPTDACLVKRTGCLLECDAEEDCAEEGGLCLDGLCRNVCG